MRDPQPENFDPKYKRKHADIIDLTGITPIKREDVFSGSQAQNIDLNGLSENRVTEPNDRTERPNRTTQPNGRTERSNGSSVSGVDNESLSNSVQNELVNGVSDASQRKTQRYSFEIYIDQIQTIEDLQYHYKKRTGKRLSTSRLIREALDQFLKNTLQTAA